MQIDDDVLREVEAVLDDTRHLVAEAAGTGFNWQDGDWAERLYANNGTISAALARLRKAMEDGKSAQTYDYYGCAPMDDLKEILAAATPGPWIFDEENVGKSGEWCWQLRTEYGGTPVYVEISNRFNRDVCHEATARLIAMAPDLAAEVLRLRAENERLTERVHELEIDEMWNAYNAGIEREDGQWGHAFMSDGEWLIRKIGLDPTIGWYPAQEIKDAINARAALKAKGTTQ